MRSQLLQALQSKKAYSHPANDITHIETHISDIFLVGEYAYKIKKPVHFEFVDYSTLEKRKQFCREEVLGNSRYAPELYLGVVEIRCYNDEFFVGGKDDGNIVEYAVKMRRFGPGDLLFDKVRRGELNTRLMEEIAEQIATFHLSAEKRPERWSSNDIKKIISDDLHVLIHHLPESVEGTLPGRCKEALFAELESNAALIEKRQKTHVKALHGDLHLKNICILDGKPRLFDGVEFNEFISSCDTWCDLGFLIMDLQYRGEYEFAGVVLNRYLELTNDYEGLALLRFAIGYRAFVRAMVNAIDYKNAKSQQQKELLEQSVAKHLALITKTFERDTQLVIAVGGLSGSGKTTLSRKLAQKLCAIHIRSDVIRKHLVGVELLERAPSEAYTEAMSYKTYDTLRNAAAYARSSGLPVIFDAVHLKDSEREAAEEFAKENGCNFFGVWCEADREDTYTRLKKRVGDASDADFAIYEKQREAELGELNWKVFRLNDEVVNLIKAIEVDNPNWQDPNYTRRQ